MEACDKIRQITLGGQTGLTAFLLEEIKRMGASLGFGPEFRYWIIFCGLFGPERNPVKYWREHEALFLELVRQDGVRGGKQLLQAIILFFTRRHPEMGKYAPNFMKLLYDQEFYDEEFIIKWFERKAKLDKTCALYDRKAEKMFRGLIEQFVNWLQ